MDIVFDVAAVLVEFCRSQGVEGEILLRIEIECALMGVDRAALEPLEFQAIG